MRLTIQIKEIDAQTTYAVRHPVLRNGRPLADCVFEGDDLLSSIHLGAYHQGTLIGVLSAYRKKHKKFPLANGYQIRGVAVLPSYQNKGIGKKLMAEIESLLCTKKEVLLWLNARESAMAFYKKINYVPLGKPFSIPLIGTHYCFYKLYEKAH